MQIDLRLLYNRLLLSVRAVALATLSFALFSLTTADEVVAQSPSGSAPSVTALTRVLDSLERAAFSGTVMVADLQNVRLIRSMGLADRESGRAIGSTDRWRWASVSKQITAALVLREVDRGRIALDSPVATYLPGFGEGARATITVRHLLQHTSGLPATFEDQTDADGTPRVYRERGADVGDAAFARLCTGAPTTAPGSRFNYNNCDYLVLGALLRSRTGKTTEALLSDLLGSSWTPAASETVRGYLNDSIAEAPFELATFGSSGAFTGSIHSLLAFDRLLLGAIMSPAARAELWKGEPRLGYAALGAWAFESGLAGCAGSVRIIERRGGIEGIQTRNVLLPDLNLVIIVFTNRADEEFGEVWQGRGLTYDLLSAAACAKTGM